MFGLQLSCVCPKCNSRSTGDFGVSTSIYVRKEDIDSDTYVKLKCKNDECGVEMYVNTNIEGLKFDCISKCVCLLTSREVFSLLQDIEQLKLSSDSTEEVVDKASNDLLKNHPTLTKYQLHLCVQRYIELLKTSNLVFVDSKENSDFLYKYTCCF